jgi:hypothetical protein
MGGVPAGTLEHRRKGTRRARRVLHTQVRTDRHTAREHHRHDASTRQPHPRGCRPCRSGAARPCSALHDRAVSSTPGSSRPPALATAAAAAAAAPLTLLARMCESLARGLVLLTPPRRLRLPPRTAALRRALSEGDDAIGCRAGRKATERGPEAPPRRPGQPPLRAQRRVRLHTCASARRAADEERCALRHCKRRWQGACADLAWAP